MQNILRIAQVMSQSCFFLISSWKSIIVIFLWRYSEKTYPEVSCWRGRSCDKFEAFILSQLLSFHNFISDLSLTIVIVLFGQDTVPVGRSDRKKDHCHTITTSQYPSPAHHTYFLCHRLPSLLVSTI